MSFRDIVLREVEGYLDRRDTIPRVLEKIRARSGRGGIAFFPCGRYSHEIVHAMRERDPQTHRRVAAFVDRSANARTDTGLRVVPLEGLRALAPDLSLLVVAEGYYCAESARLLREAGGYAGEILPTSYMDISLPDTTPGEILRGIARVCDALADEKSRAVYLATWLSRAMNDEEMTALFEGEEEHDLVRRPVRYKGFELHGLGPTVVFEMFADLYRMRYVGPSAGEVVLDIGAYKGDTAIFFADAVGASGKVYSFEPTAAGCEALKWNLERNGLLGRVEAVPMGMSDAPGEVRMMTLGGGEPWSFVSEQGSETVRVTTIDRFAAERALSRLDFVKMDVEGMESRVLAGGERTIRRFLPKLAVPLYHKTADLVELPLQVLGLGEYRIYVRSKISGPFGITLYAARR